MDFLIKIDREFPTFTIVDSQKLGFYGPLSFLLMEKSFYLFVKEFFVCLMVCFHAYFINFCPP